MGLENYKYVKRWYEKAHQALEWIDYISATQKVRDSEEHDIQVLMDRSISQIRNEIEY
jgi:hypothetical protein